MEKTRAQISEKPTAGKDSLSGNISKILRKELKQGRIHLGEALPSERDLAERYNVSTITVRQALSRLEKDGMVYRVPRVGTFAGPRPKGGPLRRQGKITIALLIPKIQIGIGPWILAGVEEACLAEGVHVEVYNACCDAMIEKQQLQRLQTSEIDGAVIVSHAPENTENIVRLKFDGVPLVVADHEIRGMESDLVTADNFQGGQLAGEHLIARRPNHYVFLTVKDDRSTNADRKNGFEDALLRRNINPTVITFPGEKKEDRDAWPYSQDAYNAALQALRTMKPPVGVFCHNDFTAVTLYHVAGDLGWAVGKELLIVGFDDEPISRAMIPALTTIRQPLEEVGAAAARLLLERLQGRVADGNFRKQVIPVKLIERKSSGSPVSS
ncbi:MAG: LacI family DNA-binding transcriptional regulator [Phycisphaerae bacterium]|nr:LacI family DNA-binding transcriptional regulator [Phycisphaerae bacterium]